MLCYGIASIINKYWESESLIEKRQNKSSAFYIQCYNINVIDKFIDFFCNVEIVVRSTQVRLFVDLYIFGCYSF